MRCVTVLCVLASLTAGVTAVCRENYYGDDCSVFCVARDDCGGHYDCEQFTGAKLCLSGWRGDGCKQKLPGIPGVTDCLSGDVCQNGGTCVLQGVGSSSYSCCCAVGFTGRHCETNINECARRPCRNGGTCYEGAPGSYRCECIPGFYGRNCAGVARGLTCESTPCHNEAVCVDTAFGFSCECKPDYTGYTCDTRVACTDRPCRNGAICQDDGFGGFSCHCPFNYKGVRCETRKTCADQPCQFGGTCSPDRTQGFVCACPIHLRGEVCHLSMTCADNPCAPWSTCVSDHIFGYRCVCPTNHQGAQCYDCASGHAGGDCATRFLTSTFLVGGGQRFAEGNVAHVDPTRYYTSYYTSFRKPEASIYDPLNGEIFIDFADRGAPRATPTRVPRQFQTRFVTTDGKGGGDLLIPGLGSLDPSQIGPTQPLPGGRIVTSTVVENGVTRRVLVREYTDTYVQYSTVGTPGRGPVEYSTISYVSYIDRILQPNVITSYLTSTLAVRSTRYLTSTITLPGQTEGVRSTRYLTSTIKLPGPRQTPRVRSTRYLTSTIGLPERRETVYSTVQPRTIYLTNTLTSTIQPSYVTKVHTSTLAPEYVTSYYTTTVKPSMEATPLFPSHTDEFGSTIYATPVLPTSTATLGAGLPVLLRGQVLRLTGIQLFDYDEDLVLQRLATAWRSANPRLEYVDFNITVESVEDGISPLGNDVITVVYKLQTINDAGSLTRPNRQRLNAVFTNNYSSAPPISAHNAYAVYIQWPWAYAINRTLAESALANAWQRANPGLRESAVTVDLRRVEPYLGDSGEQVEQLMYFVYVSGRLLTPGSTSYREPSLTQYTNELRDYGYAPLYAGPTHRRYVYHFPLFVEGKVYEVDVSRLQDALQRVWVRKLGRRDVTVDLSPAELEYVNMNGDTFTQLIYFLNIGDTTWPSKNFANMQPLVSEFIREVSRVQRPLSNIPYRVVADEGGFIPYSYLYQVNLLGYVNVDDNEMLRVLRRAWSDTYPDAQFNVKMINVEPGIGDFGLPVTMVHYAVTDNNDRLTNSDYQPAPTLQSYLTPKYKVANTRNLLRNKQGFDLYVIGTPETTFNRRDDLENAIVSTWSAYFNPNSQIEVDIRRYESYYGNAESLAPVQTRVVYFLHVNGSMADSRETLPPSAGRLQDSLNRARMPACFDCQHLRQRELLIKNMANLTLANLNALRSSLTIAWELPRTASVNLLEPMYNYLTNKYENVAMIPYILTVDENDPNRYLEPTSLKDILGRNGMTLCDGVSECEVSKLHMLNVDSKDALATTRNLETSMENAWRDDVLDGKASANIEFYDAVPGILSPGSDFVTRYMYDANINGVDSHLQSVWPPGVEELNSQYLDRAGFHACACEEMTSAPFVPVLGRATLEEMPVDKWIEVIKKGYIIQYPDGVGSSFRGCFTDRNDRRDLPVVMGNRNRTPAQCIKACFDGNFTYAGVQNGGECRCGDTYGGYGESNNCNRACTADQREQCGGPNANSIFFTGSISKLSVEVENPHVFTTKLGTTFTVLFFKVTVGQELLPTDPPTGSVFEQQILADGQRYRIIPDADSSLYDTDRAFTIYVYGNYGNGDIPRIARALNDGVLPSETVDASVLSLDRYVTQSDKEPITKVQYYVTVNANLLDGRFRHTEITRDAAAALTAAGLDVCPCEPVRIRMLIVNGRYTPDYTNLRGSSAIIQAWREANPGLGLREYNVGFVNHDSYTTVNSIGQPVTTLNYYISVNGSDPEQFGAVMPSSLLLGKYLRDFDIPVCTDPCYTTVLYNVTFPGDTSPEGRDRLLFYIQQAWQQANPFVGKTIIVDNVDQTIGFMDNGEKVFTVRYSITVGTVDSGDLAALTVPSDAELTDAVRRGTGADRDADFIAARLRQAYLSHYDALRAARDVRVAIDDASGYVAPDGAPARRISYAVLVDGSAWTPPAAIGDETLRSALSVAGLDVWYPYDGVYAESQQFEATFDGALTDDAAERHLLAVWRRVYGDANVNAYVYRVTQGVSPRGYPTTLVRYFLTVNGQVINPGFLPEFILEYAGELTRSTSPPPLEGTITINGEVENRTVIVNVIRLVYERANPGSVVVVNITSTEQQLGEDGAIVVVVRYVVYITGGTTAPARPKNATLVDKLEENGFNVCDNCGGEVVRTIYAAPTQSAFDHQALKDALRQLWLDNNAGVLAPDQWRYHLVNITMGYLARSHQPVVRIDYVVVTNPPRGGAAVRPPTTAQLQVALRAIGLAQFPAGDVYGLDYKFGMRLPGARNLTVATRLVGDAWRALRPRARVDVIVVDPEERRGGATTLRYYLSLDGRLVHPSEVGPLELAQLTRWLATHGPTVDHVVEQRLSVPGRHQPDARSRDAVTLLLRNALEAKYPGATVSIESVEQSVQGLDGRSFTVIRYRAVVKSDDPNLTVDPPSSASLVESLLRYFAGPQCESCTSHKAFPLYIVTNMTMLSIHRQAIADLLTNAWRQYNTDTLSRLPWKIEILSNVTVGYITQEGTGVLALYYQVSLPDGYDPTTDLTQPPLTDIAAGLKRLDDITLVDAGQVFKEDYQLSDVVCGAPDLKAAADKLASAWAQILGQIPSRTVRIQVFVVRMEETTRARGQEETPSVYYLKVDDSIRHPSSLTTSDRGRVAALLLQCDDDTADRQSVVQHSLRIVGKRVINPSDALASSISVAIKDVWQMANPGKTITVRDVQVGNQNPLVITYEVSATVGPDENLQQPPLQLLQDRVLRLIPGLGCTRQICSQTRPETIYVQTDAVTNINRRLLERVLSSAWAARNRRILDVTPWDLKLGEVSGGYVSAAGRPVVAVRYDVLLPETVRMSRLATPRIQQLTARLARLGLVPLPRAQVFGEEYRLRDDVPRSLPAARRVDRVAAAWSHVLANRGRVTEVRVVAMDATPSTTEDGAPATTVAYYLWADGEIVRPASLHAEDRAAAARLIWTGVQFRTVEVPGSLTLRGLGSSVNESVLTRALLAAWQQRNPTKVIVVNAGQYNQRPDTVSMTYNVLANITVGASATLSAPSDQDVRIQIALLMGGFDCQPDICTNTC
ncbi:PREDICTED: uncharacterized protein LOC106809975 [Priapulus caudatus]|uniref:Delta-like protein n=1 Tax=Priapulus caudatus TaxID=37621 RepID=A0ABM1E930_PRICU|nr:PREDICTED: uncharacterized protein LOC106809975 [Priapulus caudatus]